MTKTEIANYMNEAMANYESERELWLETKDESHRQTAQYWWDEFNKSFERISE